MLLALIGCSSEPEPRTIDRCDGPGWRDCQSELDLPEINFPEEEAAGRQYDSSETLDEFYKSARLVLSYDSAANAFTGTLVNTSSEPLPKFRVEVRLDGSAQRSAHITLVDLTVSQVREVSLQVDSEPFTYWQVLTEVEWPNIIHGDP